MFSYTDNTRLFYIKSKEDEMARTFKIHKFCCAKGPDWACANLRGCLGLIPLSYRVPNTLTLKTYTQNVTNVTDAAELTQHISFLEII